MLKHIHVDRCDSTQDLLKEQLTQNPSQEFLISCEHQEAGRGRGQNKWSDTPGTICFSLTISPHHQASFTALEISLLVSKFFEAKGRKLALKWPNDILNLQHKKCAGILVQNSGGHMMAGVGINLFYSNDDFGGVFDQTFVVNKENWSRELAQFIIDHRYDDTDELIQDWNQRCFHLNRVVRITEGDEVTEGIFKGLGQYGEALIKNDQGLHPLYNGSLRLV